MQYNDRPDPFSHPGCWAYPDMQEIGNYVGEDPLRTDEEKSHWGLWSIISSPLILGLDMSVKETMDRIWPTVTNKCAFGTSSSHYCLFKAKHLVSGVPGVVGTSS